MKKSDLRRQGGLAVAAATEKRRAEMEVERRQDLGLIDSEQIFSSKNYDIHNNTENNSVISEEEDSNDGDSDQDYDNNNNNSDNKLSKIEREMRKKSYIRSSVMNSLSEPLILTHDPVPLKLLTREELTLIAFKREKEKEKMKEVERSKEKEKIREKERRREKEKQSERERAKWSVSETYEKTGLCIVFLCRVCVYLCGLYLCLWSMGLLSVCVCVCVCVCMYIYVCVCMFILYICVCVNVFLCVCACIYMCVCECICMCVHVCVHALIYIDVCVCMYLYVCMYVCMYVSMCFNEVV